MFLVTGATGNVGGELVRTLAEAGESVRALTREPASADFPRAVETVRGDLNEPESLRPALTGARGVFLLPGYADMAGVLTETERRASSTSYCSQEARPPAGIPAMRSRPT